MGSRKDAVFGLNPQVIIEVKITLERRKPFFLLYLIFPVFALGFLNPVVFLLPPNSGEQMSLSITVLLTYSVFLTVIGDLLPSTSLHVPRVAMYLFTTFMISVCCVWLSVIMLKFFHKPEDENVPTWLQNLTCGILAKLLRIERDCPKCHKVISREFHPPSAEPRAAGGYSLRSWKNNTVTGGWVAREGQRHHLLISSLYHKPSVYVEPSVTRSNPGKYARNKIESVSSAELLLCGQVSTLNDVRHVKSRVTEKTPGPTQTEKSVDGREDDRGGTSESIGSNLAESVEIPISNNEEHNATEIPKIPQGIWHRNRTRIVSGGEVSSGEASKQEHDITWHGAVEILDNFNFWLIFLVTFINSVGVFSTIMMGVG